MFRIKQVIAFSFMFIVGVAQALLVEEAPSKIPYNRCLEYCLATTEDGLGQVTLSRNNGLYFLTGANLGAHTHWINDFVIIPQTFQAGCFEEMSLADLRFVTHSDALVASGEKKSQGSFSVLEGPANADIRKLQADRRFNGATFQVASNYNALETVDPEQDILTQSLSSYVFDNTQGPAAVLGAPAGLLFRRYALCNTLKHGQQARMDSSWGQLPCQQYGFDQRQVNFLQCICNQDTGIQMSPAGYVKLNNAVRDPLSHECELIDIGCQRATQVVFGAIDGHPSSLKTMVEIVPHKQIINQVFVAAPDFGQGTNKRSSRADAWAKTILRASYEGTLRMAHLYGSKDVVLTWVGGGAFNNDPAWVVEILEDLEPLIKELGLNVTLAAYGFTSGQEAFRGRLEGLVARTCGTWVK